MSFFFPRHAPDPFAGEKVFPWFQVVEQTGSSEAVKLDFVRTAAMAEALARKFNLVQNDNR